MKSPKASWLAAGLVFVLLGWLLWTGGVHSDRGWQYVVPDGQPTEDVPGCYTIFVGSDVALSIQAHLFTSGLTISTEIANAGKEDLHIPHRAPRVYDANQIEIPFVASHGCIRDGSADLITLKAGETCLLDSRFHALGDAASLRQLRFFIDGVNRGGRPVAVGITLTRWSK